MSAPTTDRRFINFMEAADRFATDSGAEYVRHQICTEDAFLYYSNEEVVNASLPFITPPKPSQVGHTHSHANKGRPPRLDVLPYTTTVPSFETETSATSSETSPFWSEEGDSVSGYGSPEYLVTPLDEPGYFPESKIIAQYDSVIDYGTNAFFDQVENPTYRGCLQRAPKEFPSGFDRQQHQHSSPRLLIPSIKSPKLWKGNRKALCIGIDYKKESGYTLRGCVNDAHRMRKFLCEYGKYEAKNITTLSDDGGDIPPTRDNIISAIHKLVREARKDDMLFFHYSGHGFQVTDLNGDEYDGLDEALVPADFKERGCIIDDILNEILVRKLPAGCHLTALIDVRLLN